LLGARRVGALLETMLDPGALDQLNVEQKESIRSLGEKLLRWQRLARNRSFDEMFEVVLRESGLVTAVLREPDSVVRFRRFERLFREVKRLVRDHADFSLRDFLAYLDVVSEHGASLRERNSGFVPKAVRLMTAHGAKGKEFDFVFVAGVSDGHWGNRRARQLIRLPARLVETPTEQAAGLSKESGDNDDERRLFYVAVTRARKEVFISFSKLGGEGKPQLPSQFIEEVLPELRAEGASDRYEQLFLEEHFISSS